MLFTFLLVLQALIAALLVTVILMQKSEGGGLGMGGSPSGLMSARGAADFLTRATTILATVFVILNIALAVIAATRHDTNIDTSLAHSAAAAPAAPAPAADDDAPFASAAQQAAAGGATNQAAAPAPASNSAVPLEH